MRRNDPAIQVKTLPGIRDIFSMASMDKGLTLKRRYLSCYCASCKSGEGLCKNSEYVGDWKVRMLQLDEAELRQQSGVKARPGRPKKRPIKSMSLLSLSLSNRKHHLLSTMKTTNVSPQSAPVSQQRAAK